MTAKQYTGLLALSCVIASPFVANQWLRFVKAQHAYQTQLVKEKQDQLAKEDQQQLAKEKQQLEKANMDEAMRQAIIETLRTEYAYLPEQKAWSQFQKDVEAIQNLQNSKYGGPDRDISVWCDKLTNAIQREDFAVFNYLVQQFVKNHREYLHSFTYPNLNAPGLTAEDIEALSKFIKPGAKEEAVDNATGEAARITGPTTGEKQRD